VAAVPVVSFLGYASYARLHVGCPICLGTYACVLVILVLTSTTTGVPIASLPGRLLRDARALTGRAAPLALALVLLGGVATAAVRFPREGVAAQKPAESSIPADVQAQFAAAWAQQERVELNVPAGGARVVIVKFNDYECPTCRVAEAYYRPILDRFATSHPGQVRLVFKDWPWNASCNAHAPTIPGHEAACAAAAAARMARARGKYDEMAAWLFGNQDTTPAAVQEAARRILGVTTFDAEYVKVLPDIQRDIADGAALQIHGTPSYFINGVRIPAERLLPPEYFALAIELELRRAG
jgi:protein-disulfide isomerase